MKQLFHKFWPIFVIFSVWFIFSSPYFLKGLVPFPSRYLVTFFPPWNAAYGMPVKNNAMPDVITQIYPWKKITIETWKQGQVPLWNPYSFSGTAHLGNYQSAVLSPFNLLFFILPMLHAWSILVLLQPLLAGFLVYLYLRELNLSKEASLIGGLAFMFCGFITVWMAYETLGYAVLWLPLILWGIHRYLWSSSRTVIFAVSLGLALSFFSGHFQISFYVAGVSLIYLVFETLVSQSYRKGLSLLLYYVFGICLSLPQLLPAAGSYLQSMRSGLYGQGGEIIPWQYLVTVFSPDFFGNPVTRNDWFGHYAEWASFIGVIPLLLSLYATIRKKSREQWFFIYGALFSLLMATSPVANLIIYAKLPVISTSAASRIIVIFSFSLAVLAGFGLDGLISDWKEKKRMTLYRLIFLTIIFISTLWLSVFVVKVMPAQWLIVAKRNLVLPTVIAAAGLTLMLLGFLLKNKKFVKVIIFIFIILTSFEILRYSTKWMPFDPQELVYPKTAVGDFLQKTVGHDRVFGNVYNEFTGFNLLQSIIGYDAVYQSRYGEFVSTATDGKIGIPERSVVNLDKHGLNSEKILEFLGVKYLIHRLSDGTFGWAYPYWNYSFYKSIYKDEYYEIFENTQALPRAFLASSYKVIIDKQKIIDQMFSPEFNLRDTLVLETKPISEPQSGVGNVRIEKYQSNSIRLSVNTTVPKLLFFSDVYDSGWQATVDGKSTPVYRADYDFRAISVPAGNHTVEFIYNPFSFRIGLVAAGLAGIILLVILLGRLLI